MAKRKSYSIPMDYRTRRRIQREFKKRKKIRKELFKMEDREARKGAKRRNILRRLSRQTEVVLDQLVEGNLRENPEQHRNTFKGQVEEFVKDLPASKVFYSICPRCLNDSFGTWYGELNMDIVVCGSCLLMLVLDREKPFRWNFDFYP